MSEIQFRHFKFNLPVRIAIAAAVYALTVTIQVITDNFYIYMPILILAWPFLALKSANNVPHDIGEENWRAVGEGGINRILDTNAQSAKVKTRVVKIYAIRFFSTIGLFISLVLINTAFYLALNRAFEGLPNMLSVTLVDFYFMLIPSIWFGRVKIHSVVNIDKKLPSFNSLKNVSCPQNIKMIPHFRFDKNKEGQDIPEDVRYILECKDTPIDFINVQFQVTINKGPNGDVPYMYAVFLTRGKDGVSYKKISQLQSRGFIFEAGGNDEYGTIVVRQHTGNGGYYTKPEQCQDLFKLVLSIISKINE